MSKLDDDIDALFKLPLTEFIGARKALAARLKQNGFATEAEGVKVLAKPSTSAWTVNQLYWRHREAFDELIATGQRFHKAQATGKMVNMREALDARRDALSDLSELATEALRDAGHNPSLDTLRRIGTTLEALSAYASLSGGPTLGRLTEDIDPPGFDSFGAFTPSTPSAGTTKRAAEQRHVSPSKKVVTASKKAPAASSKTQGSKAAAEANRREARQARINIAKASLQQARKSLTAARAAVKSLEGAQKKAEAGAKEAVKHKREAEERFKKASAASTDATLRAQSIDAELTKATKTLADATRAVESATKELEKSFREAT